MDAFFENPQPGFEPGLRVPKTPVLPLHHRGTHVIYRSRGAVSRGFYQKKQEIGSDDRNALSGMRFAFDWVDSRGFEELGIMGIKDRPGSTNNLENLALESGN